MTRMVRMAFAGPTYPQLERSLESQPRGMRMHPSSLRLSGLLSGPSQRQSALFLEPEGVS